MWQRGSRRGQYYAPCYAGMVYSNPNSLEGFICYSWDFSKILSIHKWCLQFVMHSLDPTTQFGYPSFFWVAERLDYSWICLGYNVVVVGAVDLEISPHLEKQNIFMRRSFSLYI